MGGKVSTYDTTSSVDVISANYLTAIESARDGYATLILEAEIQRYRAIRKLERSTTHIDELLTYESRRDAPLVEPEVRSALYRIISRRCGRSLTSGRGKTKGAVVANYERTLLDMDESDRSPTTSGGSGLIATIMRRYPRT